MSEKDEAKDEAQELLGGVGGDDPGPRDPLPRAAIVVKNIAVFRVVEIHAPRKLVPGDRPYVVVEYERPHVTHANRATLYLNDTLNMDWSGDGPVTGMREAYLRREAHGEAET